MATAVRQWWMSVAAAWRRRGSLDWSHRALGSALVALVVFPLIVGVQPRVAYAAVVFSVPDPDRLVIETSAYRLVFSRWNGGIMEIVDRQRSNVSMLPSGLSGCLWLAVFPPGTQDPPATPGGAPIKRENVSGCDFQREGAPERTFNYNWNGTDSVLTLTYEGGPAPNRQVSAEVKITARESDFDMQLTQLQNRWNAEIRSVLLPVDLKLVDADVERVFGPFTLPGVRLNREYFSEILKGCQFVRTYPGGDAFADYLHLHLNRGHITLFTVSPAAPKPVSFGFTDDVSDTPECSSDAAKPPSSTRFRVYHAYRALVPHNTTYTSPLVRLLVGQPEPRTTIGAYRVANGIQSYQTVQTKLGSLFEKVAGATLVKVDIASSGVPFYDARWQAAQEALPFRSLVHPVAFQPKGHDDNYPDLLPPSTCWDQHGGQDFKAWIQQLQARGHLIMPYTNPTWWDDEVSGIDSLAVREANGDPAREQYRALTLNESTCTLPFGQMPVPFKSGFVMSPLQTGVQNVLAAKMAEWQGMGVDLIFEDQIGARQWRYDENSLLSAVARLAFAEGWLAHVHTYRDRRLMMEQGWDRLAADSVGFHGSLLNLGSDSRYGDVNWGPGRWAPYPLALWLLGDKVLFYQHNLATTTMLDRQRDPEDNRSIVTWNLAYGTLTSWYWHWSSGQPFGEVAGARWLDLAAALQRTLGPRYAGRIPTAYVDQPENRLTRTTFDQVTVQANWHESNPRDEGPHQISSKGFLATTPDGSVLAGSLTKLNGQQLENGTHIFVVERTTDTVTVRKPIGQDTQVQFEAPADWSVGETLHVIPFDRAGQFLAQISRSLNGRVVSFRYQQVRSGTEIAGYLIQRKSNIPSCDPRPPVTVQTTQRDLNTIDVRIVAGQGDLTEITAAGSVNVANMNARVEMPKGTAPTALPRTYVPLAGSTEVTITVRRIQAGQPFTVPLTIKDACTSQPWRSLVGHG